MINSNLTEITTSRQTSNGTRMFRCNRTNTLYASYASGYVRRGILAKSATDFNSSNNRDFIFYKLNPTASGKHVLFTSEADRIETINRRSSSYKV